MFNVVYLSIDLRAKPCIKASKVQYSREKKTRSMNFFPQTMITISNFNYCTCQSFSNLKTNVQFSFYFPSSLLSYHKQIKILSKKKCNKGTGFFSVRFHDY